MNTSQPQPGRPLGPAGFDAVYRGDVGMLNRDDRARAAGMVHDRAPWDIGEPQPVVREIEARGQISSEVLDMGCGPGDNAMFLAGHGYRVLGLDAAPAAIERASRRAAERHAAAHFAVADATSLAGYSGRFATVLDSALYHCLTEDERAAYLRAAHRACLPGARLHLICFSDALPDWFPGPYRISEARLRAALAGDWRLRDLRPATYTTIMTRDLMERRAPTEMRDVLRAAGVRYDDSDRLLVPAWLATAERH